MVSSPTRRRTSARGIVAVLTGAALVFASPWAAGQSNDRNAPIGGRSQLLGGTGMAYGRDATAAFLNPATAVLTDDSRLSFSVNFYRISHVSAPRWFAPGPVDESKFGKVRIDNPAMTALDFDALPSSLCLLLREGTALEEEAARKARSSDARIGFCFATIQSQSLSLSALSLNEAHASSVTRQQQAVNESYSRFAAGPTYALNLSRVVAIGASLHGSLASHESLLSAGATTYGASAAPIDSMFYASSQGTSFQVEATLGATLHFGSQTVGMSVRSPSLHLYGVGNISRQSHYDGAGSATSALSAHGSFVSHTPVRFGLGTGTEGKWGMFEFDTTWSLPTTAFSAELDGQVTTLSPGPVSDSRTHLSLSSPARGVVNFATGLEMYISERISLLGGASTDLSAVPSGSLAQQSIFNFYPERTERLSGSFGVSSHGRGGELLVGTEFSYGWGDRLAVNSYQLPPAVAATSQTSYQILFVIAGSTKLSNIKRAVEDVKDVLVPGAAK